MSHTVTSRRVRERGCTSGLPEMLCFSNTSMSFGARLTAHGRKELGALPSSLIGEVRS